MIIVVSNIKRESSMLIAELKGKSLYFGHDVEVLDSLPNDKVISDEFIEKLQDQITVLENKAKDDTKELEEKILTITSSKDVLINQYSEKIKAQDVEIEDLKKQLNAIPTTEVKEKRKRRTKEEIEADKLKESENK